jgi:indolepyruvate ferredoxin oxidoreductase, alpha subunit
MKVLMSGNEAIARGAYESGVTVAAAYPGTPSTEILENIIKYPVIKAQWSPNEKVALEVGIGASIAGARTIVTMKHVGVNVAADPLFTAAYTGVRGGLVIVSADDPGMHSSQNEQDNRYYGKFAKIPVVEPSDSQEAKDYVRLALELSEKFDTPVILRTTTRIAHSQTLVEETPATPPVKYEYQKDEKKYVMVPAHARQRHVAVEHRREELNKFAETTPLNQTFWKDKRIGVITSGITFQYVREAAPEVSILKLGLTNPLPVDKIRIFASQVDQLFIVEELEPFLEEQIKALGIKCIGKDVFPRMGELSTTLLSKVLNDSSQQPHSSEEVSSPTSIPPLDAPPRPPVLCPGCPHRGVFYTLKQLNLVVSGDIGCYTLGALAPLSSIDTTVCMGYSISGALGMEKADPELARRMVAVIGDSTFLHSGMTGLLDTVYNHGTTTILILDNRTTAMTGQQQNPGTGKDLNDQAAPQVDFEALVKALGVKRVLTVDPFDLVKLKRILQEELAALEPSVIISRRPCVFVDPAPQRKSVLISQACTGCKACMKLGCPSLRLVDSKVQVDTTLCTGCNLCASVCKFGAIEPAQEVI